MGFNCQNRIMTMKKMNKQFVEDEAKVDMTPMLDIVFIMLIFFIVTTSFVKEKAIDVNRPDDSSQSTSNSKNVSILIDQHGMIMMNGRQVDIRRVTANTQTILAETDTDLAIIKAHKETRHGTVIEVIDQIKIAGITRISVMVIKE